MTRTRIKTKEPAPSALRELINYDPESGELTWKNRPKARKEWNSRYAGKPAFQYACPFGYRRGQVLGVRMLAHRVAWAIYHGESPQVIDHINGDPSDNRIANLRSVDQTTNMRNIRMRSSNTTGFTGVVLERNGKYRAQIGPEGRIGTFETPEVAFAAYVARARALGFILRGGTDHGPEIARLRGEAQAVSAAARQKGC